ncbi:hypothetical protein EIN_404610 [Entamoeba invadens IP1]|uniref:Peptidase S74 domain-containing protein n=1 Tax=Entamoeba invadens IP1 TaxID=370355 RepID=A0A0A1U6P3_ENTIV|nr:hypothetical protein EIN_404610 [Entamoeba invadens IP1]ELP90067.1 hypothetical protein EIN_404610 [Entamoeba invadens IP1]|eukprot:XP_004256838.1 hypothetical protein EIN_404610 [Entamoeba invadens IP1]
MMNQFTGIMNIPVKEVPRTQTQRKKNWKCGFQGCNKLPMTRYNAYAHIWDSHVKPQLTDPSKNVENICLTSFKNLEERDKVKVKKMCDKFMIKLVDKTQGRQTYPFAFTEAMAPIIGNALNKMQKDENKKECVLKPELLTVENYDVNASSNETTTSPHFSSLQRLLEEKDVAESGEIKMESDDVKPDQEYDVNDLLKIKRIGNKLQQLHMFGEVFADEGFLVRSDEKSKTHFQSIGNALYGLSQLCGRQFKYLTDPQKAGPRYGFLAQEVQQVYPDLVSEDEEGGLSVDMIGVIPIMVEALKEIEKESDSLALKTHNEFKTLSSTAKNALRQLNYVEDEFHRQKSTYDILLNKKREYSRNDPKHCFGPTLFLVFSAIAFSVSALIVPLIKPLYLIESVLIVIACVQWSFVIVNKDEVKDLIVKPDSLLTVFKNNVFWSSLQVVSWSIVITAIFCSFTISFIVGVMGILICALYALIFISLITLTAIIHFNCSKQFRSVIALTIMASFHVIGAIALISLISMQPYHVFEMTSFNTITSVQTGVGSSIVPVSFPSLPWNCYDPTFLFSAPLPSNLEISLTTKRIGLTVPCLIGVVLNRTDYVGNVILQCGFTKMDYTTLIIVSV